MYRFARNFVAGAVLVLTFTPFAFAQVAGAPTLKLITPADGQTVYGTKVPVIISAENFQIVDYQINPYNRVGQGHVHLWLDDANPTRESAVKLTKDSFTYQDVSFGDHKLTAELVNSDHTSLTPPVATTVNFKSVPLTSPSPAAASGFDKNTALVILIVVALVIVAAWWYTKEEEEAPTQKKSSPRRSSRRRTRRRR